MSKQLQFRSSEADGDPDGWWYDTPEEAATDVLDSLPLEEWDDTVTIYAYRPAESCPCGEGEGCEHEEMEWFDFSHEVQVDTILAVASDAIHWMEERPVRERLRDLARGIPADRIAILERDLAAAREEIERLRGALEAIRDGDFLAEAPTYAEDAAWQGVREIARKALGRKEDR